MAKGSADSSIFSIPGRPKLNIPFSQSKIQRKMEGAAMFNYIGNEMILSIFLYLWPYEQELFHTCKLFRIIIENYKGSLRTLAAAEAYRLRELKLIKNKSLFNNLKHIFLHFFKSGEILVFSGRRTNKLVEGPPNLRLESRKYGIIPFFRYR